MKNIFSKEWILNHLPWAFAIVTFIILLPAIFIADIPSDDVLARYIPMAEAFGRGDFWHAFHPRIPFLLPVVSGCFVKIFGFTPFFAVKFTSILFFALAFLVMIPLFQRIFPQRVVILGGCLAMLSPQVMRMNICGLRESGKVFFYMLCVYALVVLWQERHSWKAHLLLALGCGCMMYTRDETVLFACIFLTVAFFVEIFRSKRIPFRTCFVSFPLVLIILIPLLMVNFKLTGYAVPSHRFIYIVSKVQEKFGWNAKPAPMEQVEVKKEQPQQKKEVSPYEPIFQEASKNATASKKKFGEAYELMQQAGSNNRDKATCAVEEAKVLRNRAIKLLEQVPEKDLPIWYRHMLTGLRSMSLSGFYIQENTKKDFLEAVWDVLQSYYLLFFLPALFGVGLRIFRREFRSEELFVLLCGIMHSVLIAAQMFITQHVFAFVPRYGLSLSVVFVPWTVVTVLFVYDLLNKYVFERYPWAMRWRKSFLVTLCVCVGIAFYASGMNAEIRQITSSGKREELKVTKSFAKAIREDYKGPATCKVRNWEPEVYYADKRPKVYTEHFSRLGYFAGGENLKIVWYGKDKRKPIVRFDEVRWRNFSTQVPVDYCVFCVAPDEKIPEVKGFVLLKEECMNGKKYILLKNPNADSELAF